MTLRQPPDFQILFESAPALYLVLTPDLTIVAASDAYLESTMTRRDQIVGRGMFEVFPINPDEPGADGTSNVRASMLRTVETQKPDSISVQKYDIRKPDGTYEVRYWSPIHSPVFHADGTLAYIIHRVEDVTEFIQLQQEHSEQEKLTETLLTKAEHLEAQIMARAGEVQQANQKLRGVNEEMSRREQEITQLYERLSEVDQLKTQLFANVSHELRTPLALILGLAENLLASGALPSDQVRHADGIVRNANVLLKHVNDLLDVAKLESGKMAAEYAEIDLAALVRQTASHFETLAYDRGLAYRVETPETLTAQVDPDKIQRVLMNLLSNAFKFTPSGGSVVCRLRADADRAVLSVADSGQGIPAHLRESVFDRFFQVEESSTRRFGGTGLGLSIAREFAELHHGTITADESESGGALMALDLPLCAPSGTPIRQMPPDSVLYSAANVPQAMIDVQMPAEAAGEADQAPDGRPLVLVVEDNPDMSRFIRETLSARYATAAAFNGRDGTEKAFALKPDLIMSDVMMPDMSGPQMVEAIRSRPELESVPILMLTAKTDEATRVRLLREGAQDFLLKPFSSEELKARAGNLIALKQAREAVAAQNERLTQAVADLETANKELDSFSYSISHDLRAPLRSIDGFALMLAEDYAPQLDSEGQRYIETVRQKAQTMSQLIDDLLTFAKLARQPLQKHTVRIEKLVQRVLADLAPDYEQRRVEITIGALPDAQADESLLRQVFINLLSNALKYSAKRDPAVIEVGSYDESGERVYYVKDNGVGFDLNYAGKLFEVFQRFHKASDYAGTGAGLAIVRQIVTRHQGRVWAEAAVDQGATFFFALPNGGVVE